MAERVLSVRLRAIVDGYEAAMGRAALATDKVAATGKQMASTGKAMTMGFSLPMIAAGGFALKSAVSFESAFAGVQKTVNGTTAELAQLQQGIIDMANSTPSTREDIAAIAEAAGQMGVSTPNVLGFTKTLVDLGNATNLAGEEGATMLAQFANITQMPQSDFGRLGSTITALGNAGAATEQDIGEMALRLAGAGSQVKMTEAQIVSLASGLADLRIPAELGGSAVSRVLTGMQTAVIGGGKDLEAFGKIAGMTGQQFAEMFRGDATAAFMALLKGLQGISAAGGSTATALQSVGLAEQTTLDVMNRLTGAGDKLSASQKVGERGWRENIALTNEANMRYATTESQLKMAGNRITDVARQFGELLVPAVHATLNVVEPLTGGMGRLAQLMAALPTPIKAVGGSMAGIAIAAGPTMWALGKLSTLYGPLTSGAIAVAGNLRYMAQAIAGIAATQGVSKLTATVEVLKSSLLGMVGPQVAVVAGIAAIAAGAYLAKRRLDDMRASHLSAGDAAKQLADSAGLISRDLGRANDEYGRAAVTADEFRRANQESIVTLRTFASELDKQSYLRELGYQLVLRGATPEAAFDQIKQLAATAGVEVPVSLTVDNIDDFENQIAGVIAKSQRLGNVKMITPWSGAAEELNGIGAAAADAFSTDNIAGFVQILGESQDALGDNYSAINRVTDEALKGLGEGLGVSTTNAGDLLQALHELQNAPGLGDAEKAQLRAIEETASAMDKGKGLLGENAAANLAAAAAIETHGYKASEFAEKVGAAEDAAKGLAAGTNNQTEQQKQATVSAEAFADALDKVSANASFARMDFDAGAAAAQAFGEAMDRSTQMGARMSAGLQGGAALKALGEGMTGQKRISEIQRQAAKETEKSAKSLDRLGDAARRTDPRMAALQIRLEALKAAGQAFTESIDNSSMLDDQVSSALNLGDAYSEFESTYKRLPQTLDVTAMAMGKLRPRQAEAVQNMLSMGKAARDYLKTLIEMGSSDAEVAGQASRMRGEYERMFREMGMGEDAVRQYIEAMGLAPEQINTAVTVSGIEAAQSRLQAYVSLLQGKIPDEVATSVVGKIEAGDIEGAASQLADYARSNPALIEVGVDSSSVDKTQEQIADVKAQLWELPASFDPLTAMLGGYTDAQQSALDAVMQFGDAYQSYLSTVAHDGNKDEIRDQALQIREAFLEQIGMGDQVGLEYSDMSASAKSYLDLIGMSDWQINSAINLSGDAEAMARLQLYSQFLGEKIPPDVMTNVLAQVDAGNLQGAADQLAMWRAQLEATNQIKLKVGFDNLAGLAPGMTEIATGRDLNGNHIIGMASGGRVSGPGSGTSDRVLRRVSNGEFVTREAAASSIGYDAMAYMNRTGTLPNSGGTTSAAEATALMAGPTIPGTNLPVSTQLPPMSAAGDPALLAEIRALRSELKSGDTFQFTGDLVAPSPERMPRAISEAVGSGRFLAGGRR